MAGPDSGSSEQSNSSKLEGVCDAFDQAWATGQQPDLAEFLEQVAEPLRDPLLEKLLPIDLEYRIKSGEIIEAGLYAALGPQVVAKARQLIKTGIQDDATEMHSSSTSASAKQIGPYKLLQQIGEGGMGTVWMADQQEPVKRRVALKVIKAGMDSKQVIARFEAERQALAMMDHQNIAKVLDAGMTGDGRPYFAMELVQGIPFTQYCDQNKLSLQERLELFVPICHAVQHAHQKGIIHRDLKPSNVLVTLYDGKPVPKVIDFGLAKALQHQVNLTDKTMFTEFGQVVGTLQYMSPEQAEMNALDVDTRTDIYSLGVMLYELLTGSTPLEAETVKQDALLQILQVIKEKEPPRPSSRLSSSGDAITGISEQRKITPAKLQQILRGELDWVVMKALEKDRTRRYETANDFAEDISRYLNDEVVVARPPSTGYKVSKFVKKNRGLVATLTTIAALLFAGIASTSWFAIQADAAREVAVEEKDRADIERDRATEKEHLANVEAERANTAEEKTKAALEETEATLARSNYFLAVARWDANRALEANELLDKVPLEYRNFEWRLARRQFLGSDITCYGHTGEVNSVAFSPDGRRLATGSWDKTIKLWDVASGSELRTLTGHTEPVWSVAFSPDGARLATGSADDTIKLWDVASGSELRTLTGHTNGVQSVAFSPDGTRLATGSGDSTIKLWDAASGSELRTLTGHTQVVSSVAFSPDGTRLATGSWDRTIKLWDAASGSELRTLTGHTQVVTSVAFSPDGARLASGSVGETIKLWDVASGNELRTLGQTRGVQSVAFSPDGTRLATGSSDKTIKLWDVASGSELRTFTGHTNRVTSVAFSPDGARLATGSADDTIKLWDVASGSELRTLTGHTNGVTSVAFSPEGARLATGSFDNTIKLWDVASGSELRTLTGHTEPVWSVAFSPDGARLATGSADDTIKLWDVASGSELRTLTGHTNGDTSVAFSPDGARLATGSFDNTIKLWDVASGSELRTLTGHTEPVRSVAFSPDGTRLATGSWDRTIKLWDAASGSELRTLTGHTQVVTSVAFSPDGARLATGSYDYTIKLWDVASGSELRTLGQTRGVQSVAFSPDGTRLATGSGDSTIKLWDVASGSELRTLTGHTSSVWSVAFSPDGTRLASGSVDRTIKLWDAASGSELRTLTGHADRVTSVAISPDGTHVYSKDQTGQQIVWDTTSGKQLPTAEWKNIKNDQRLSHDERWLVTSSGNNVFLVDLEFKNTPREKAYRQFKAKPNPFWHAEQAKIAEENKNWFAATFNRAWVMKADPDSAVAYLHLHAAYEKLEADYAEQEKELSSWLHPVVTGMLKLPRGKKFSPPPPLTANDAQQINNAIWEKVKAPPADEETQELTELELIQVRNVCAQHPLGNYFNTLATAEYRMGNYELSIEAALKSVELTPQELGLPGPHPVDLAILAMSYRQLGDQDKANDYLNHFD